MWMKKHLALVVVDRHLATMIKADLSTKLTMQMEEGKDRRQTLGHIIVSSSYLESRTVY